VGLVHMHREIYIYRKVPLREEALFS
jgi:hypothetical protein